MFTEKGITPRKVVVDVEELLRWCNSKKLPVDGAARSEFVAEKLRERSEENQ